MAKIREIGDGHINDTYLLDDGKEKVIVQKLGKSFGRIPDIKPVTDYLKGKFDTVEVLDNWRITSYKSGKVYTPEEITEKQLLEAVDVVAEFHNAIQGFDKAEELNQIHSAVHILELADKYKKLEKLPKRVIHGDMRLDNIMFKNGKPYTLIDLDTVHKSYIVWDIANMIFMWTGGVKGKPNQELAKKIKKRYLDKIDFLTQEEVEMIDFTTKLYALELHYRFQDYDYFSKLSKEYCDKRSKAALKYYESVN